MRSDDRAEYHAAMFHATWEQEVTECIPTNANLDRVSNQSQSCGELSLSLTGNNFSLVLCSNLEMMFSFSLAPFCLSTLYYS